MAEVAKLADDLLAQPWISVHIGDSPFLLKASFGDAAYKLMLSDFDSVWWEEMNSDGLEQRAQELNKRLKAPVSAFCRHLREAVAPLLRGGSGDPLPGFSCERAQNLISVGLRTELSGVPFYWTFHCTEAPLSMVSCHMICPLLNMMQALHRQTRDLMLLLERKDAEILDYKENGATLSRDRLETETFNAEEFKDRFLAESLSEAISVQDGRLFNTELQRLYTMVTAAKTRQKRGHDSGEEDNRNSQPSLEEAQNIPPIEPKEELAKPTPAESSEVKKQALHRLHTSAPRNSVPSIAKQKKKKSKGIFS
ncbi:non-homologous end-joining factor 1 isoform X1 [Carcharodon carcharias]|uniref:non-homologous end-joining factor 1 isoform X1 n=1 Tax=Carcharodon carcharias TaxID=13397 RepID=UPI001B7F1F3A|nr:non-homologous end-joining factor 1 isoform X1 [Carcharodon carcharias]XP_041057637.1 non-homologous end-joining factor 1 isoform X1 [Carcharodon carcharias]